MKVKTGNKIYDSSQEPVMVILSNWDKINIANMHADCAKYACFPDHYPPEEMDGWMEVTPSKEEVHQKGIRIVVCPACGLNCTEEELEKYHCCVVCWEEGN